MARATWTGATIAESDDVVELEGNLYFPRSALDDSLIKRSDTTTRCPWKGPPPTSLVVAGQCNPDAVWTYEKPSPAARRITDRVAFWHGVTVEADPTVVSRGHAVTDRQLPKRRSRSA